MASQFPQNLLFRSKDTAFPSGYSSLVSWDECVWAQPGDSGEEAVGGEVLTAQSVLLAVPPALSAAGGPPPHLACQGPQAVVQVQFSSVAQWCPTLCNPTDCSTPSLPVHHQPPEFTQTHVHWVGDAVQPSHPLSSPSPPAFNLSQYQGLFKWVCSFFASGGQNIGVSASTSVLPMNTQDWSPLGWTGWISLQSKGHSRVFSNTVVQSINSSVLSFPYSPTLTPYTTTGKTIALTRWTFVGKVMSKWGYIIHPLVCTTVPPNTKVLGVPPMQACPPWCQLAQVCLKPSVGCEEHAGHHHGALDSSWVGEDST